VVNPRHPEHFDDPASIPVLTDVIVPGRPPIARRSEASEIDTLAVPAAPVAEAPLPQQAAHAAELSEFGEPVKPVKPIESHVPVESVQPAGRDELLPPLRPLEQAALTERDAEHIAERLRARFAGYLREEGRRVIEARCREALEEHTSWLVRQVTREVALALEGEVMGWVRDAVREELAAHQASRR
jgi:hypothetical protein